MKNKKQQILIIGGGETFRTRAEYMRFLKNLKIDLERMKFGYDWKGALQDKLGESFDVYTPKMPNNMNAQYEEWKIIFEKVLAKLSTGPILIGHSLGGIFLAKYLSENKISKRIKATILVAAPYDDADEIYSLASFSLKKPLTLFAKQAGKIYIFQSNDDPVVSDKEARKYKEKLPEAELMLLDEHGHFNSQNFPEIVKVIKSL